MTEVPHTKRGYCPAREVPSSQRMLWYAGLGEKFAGWGILPDRISNIDELLTDRKAEIKRDLKRVLHLGIDICQDLKEDLMALDAYSQGEPSPQDEPETLHRHIHDSYQCLCEALGAIGDVWNQGWALRRMTEDDWDRLKKMCGVLTPEEALGFADQYLRGRISLQELHSQIVKDHPERY